jgi:hypothetical protein
MRQPPIYYGKKNATNPVFIEPTRFQGKNNERRLYL